MLIPKSITLAGLTIEVVVAPTLHADKGLGGYSDYPGQRIILAGDIHPQMRAVTFLHECLHFIFFVMGEEQLRDNEKFVDVLAHFLHQALTSREEHEPRDIGEAYEELLEDNTRLQIELCNHANPERVIAWMKDQDRKPAHLAFTEGPERQIGYAVEQRLALGKAGVLVTEEAAGKEVVAALSHLLAVMNPDKEGGYFICHEAEEDVEAARKILEELQ